MPILGTVSSGYVELPYALSQTFNASGTYTVPSGKTKIAAFVVSGGGAGGHTGNNPYAQGAGAGGGASGYLVAFSDYSVTSGQQFAVTIGAGGTNPDRFSSSNNGGTSSFGNLVTVNGGNAGSTVPDYQSSNTTPTYAGGSAGSYTSNIPSYIVTTANNNTGGGAGGPRSMANTPAGGYNGVSGTAGSNGGLLVNMNLTGLGSVSSGINTGSGGGGGSGAFTTYWSNNVANNTGGNGGAGGTGSGSGGKGGQFNGGSNNDQGGYPYTDAVSGGAATGTAGGGGGASGQQGTIGYSFNPATGGGGYAGQVVVYVQ